MALLETQIPEGADPATITDRRSFTAFRTIGGGATPVGLDPAGPLQIALDRLSVAFNRGGGTLDGQSNHQVLDFKTTPLLVNAGGGTTITMDFDGTHGEILEAAGLVTLTISEFAHVSGEMAFRKQEQLQVTPLGSNTTVPVSLLTVGANKVRAFVGVGGPYWQDSDHDRDIDDSDVTAAAGALGVALENVGFGLALMKPVTAGWPTRFHGQLRGAKSSRDGGICRDQ